MVTSHFSILYNNIFDYNMLAFSQQHPAKEKFLLRKKPQKKRMMRF